MCINGRAIVSYVMEKERRIWFGSHYKFPLKLYKVVDDETIIRWADDGSSVVVEQLEFEGNVMHYYPGFVQVKSFHNLRRLFRDYGFGFQVLRKRKPYGLKLKFRHPFFTRAKPDDVTHVQKISRRYSLHREITNNHLSRRHLQCSSFSKPRVLKCYKYGGMLKPENYTMGNSCRGKYSWSSAAPSTLDGDYTDTMLPSVEVLPVNTGSPDTSHHRSQVPESVRAGLTQDDMLRLAQILAKNEMSAGEFWQLMARRCGHEWADRSWDGTLSLLASVVCPEFSLLHHRGFYYQLSMEDL